MYRVLFVNIIVGRRVYNNIQYVTRKQVYFWQSFGAGATRSRGTIWPQPEPSRWLGSSSSPSLKFAKYCNSKTLMQKKQFFFKTDNTEKNINYVQYTRVKVFQVFLKLFLKTNFCTVCFLEPESEPPQKWTTPMIFDNLSMFKKEDKQKILFSEN